jgi:cytochrome c556
MLRSMPALAAALFIGLAAPTQADTPADVVKYRKGVMNAMAAHTGSFVLVNFGKISQPSHLQDHADALADLGAQTKSLFPAGSAAGDTDSLPLIWQEPERFNQAVVAVRKPR